jgi:ABC-type uncharacterized transport system ATPase subunit
MSFRKGDVNLYAVEMKNITKRFSNVIANNSVKLSIKKGEIHSLLGENGAGKTTLMKILYGMYQPDEGEIFINGKKETISSPAKAIRLGIAMVHQHFMLVEPMTVAENIVLGYEPRKGIFFNMEQAAANVQEISEKYGLKVDPLAKIEDLPVGTKQRVEILKALYRKAEILILDEPTAVLTPLEVKELFSILKELKKIGKSIIIITHKLNETMDIADRITVLRGGNVIDTMEKCDTDESKLAQIMVGRKVSFEINKKEPAVQKKNVLVIKNAVLGKKGVQKLKGINLELNGGEILGLAGVEGNGQSELVEVLTGITPLEKGCILLNGKDITNSSPIKMLESGIGHIPEDREKRGLVKEFSIKDNLILGYHRKKQFSSRGILNRRNIESFAQKISKQFNIKAENHDVPVSTLSGGNEQKVVIGRVLSEDPEVIIAAQPTRGVDIGAIEYIHKKLMEMKDQGKAILLISAELDEIIKLSDRIAVIYEGKITACGRTQDFSESRLGLLMTGGKTDKSGRIEKND